MSEDVTSSLHKQIEELSRELEATRAKLQQADANLTAIREGEVDSIIGIENMLHVIPQEALDSLIAQAESQAVAIFRNVGVAIITIDEAGTVQHFNPAAERLFGYASDEIVGSNISVLMLGEPSERILQDTMEKLPLQYLNKSVEVYAKKKDDSIFLADLYMAEFTIGEQRMFIGSVTDITEQKRSKEELEQLVAERTAKLNEAIEIAENASRIKSEFLSNMSHELRTPMNSVLGFLSLTLGSPDLPENLRYDLEVAHRAGQNLLVIINDILDVQKIETGKIELENVCFNLPRGIEEILQEFKGQADENGISLSYAYDNNLSHHVVGDFNRLRQILTNLIGNAIKFTPGGTIRLSVEKLAEEEGLVQFAVKDSGIGIDQEKLERIFESFTQEDGTTARQYGGTGLGLTLVEKLASLMGGRAWAESVKGVGSTFFFTARLRLEDLQTRECKLFLSSDEASLPPLIHPPRSFNVLLAEDVRENAQLVQRAMNKAGHRITWVHNGQEAVKAHAKGGFDIILMDIHMPYMDGHEATRIIRAFEARQGGHIPIIALTAAVMLQEQKQSIQSGMDAHVAKPIDFPILFAEMERLVPEGSGEEIPSETTVDIAPAKDPCDELNLQDSLSKIQGVNVAEGLRRYSDDIGFYSKHLKGFSKKFGHSSAQIRECLAANDPESCAIMAHTLKGVAGNLGIKGVYDVAAEIETAVKNGSADIEGLLLSLNMHLDAVVSEITSHLDNDCLENTEAGPIDIDKALTLLSACRTSLEKNERDSQIVTPLKEMFSGNPIFTRMEAALDQFDFQSAIDSLDQLSDSLKAGD